MYVRVREEFDADQENLVTITDYVTEKNKFEIYCRSCNKTLYADENTLTEYNHAVELGLDSPYVCNDCLREESEILGER